MGIILAKMKFTSATLIAATQAGVMELTATTNMQGEVPFCIGCQNAELGQFPWQLSLQTTGHFCGGSILSPTALATAAHCRKSTYYAVAGTIDNRTGQKIIKVYAVGRVSTPFIINENAKPIPLVNPSEQRPADRHPLVTSGYGYYQYGSNGRPISQVSQYLKWTDIEYVSVARCKSIWTGQTIDESVICADKDDASICSGDSGGPLVIDEDGEQRLIGMTSWAHVYCRSTGLPQGWANAQWPEYNAWMREQAEL